MAEIRDAACLWLLLNGESTSEADRRQNNERNVQCAGTAGSLPPLSFSPKLSKSRSVFAPLSKSAFQSR